MTKKAIVLFNLGGPDSPEAIRPFLYNLFSDPAILRLPGIVRKIAAKLIAWKRAQTARASFCHAQASRGPHVE